MQTAPIHIRELPTRGSIHPPVHLFALDTKTSRWVLSIPLRSDVPLWIDQRPNANPTLDRAPTLRHASQKCQEHARAYACIKIRIPHSLCHAPRFGMPRWASEHACFKPSRFRHHVAIPRRIKYQFHIRLGYRGNKFKLIADIVHQNFAHPAPWGGQGHAHFY